MNPAQRKISTCIVTEDMVHCLITRHGWILQLHFHKLNVDKNKAQECNIKPVFHQVIYRSSLFFRLVNFRQKKYSRKIQTKLNKNNFTSRVLWALIEEIAPHAEGMAGEKEMACCVRGYHVYKDIWAAQLGMCWCIVAGVSFENFCCKIIFA